MPIFVLISQCHDVLTLILYFQGSAAGQGSLSGALECNPIISSILWDAFSKYIYNLPNHLLSIVSFVLSCTILFGIIFGLFSQHCHLFCPGLLFYVFNPLKCLSSFILESTMVNPWFHVSRMCWYVFMNAETCLLNREDMIVLDDS